MNNLQSSTVAPTALPSEGTELINTRPALMVLLLGLCHKQCELHTVL